MQSVYIVEVGSEGFGIRQVGFESWLSFPVCLTFVSLSTSSVIWGQASLPPRVEVRIKWACLCMSRDKHGVWHVVDYLDKRWPVQFLALCYTYFDVLFLCIIFHICGLFLENVRRPYKIGWYPLCLWLEKKGSCKESWVAFSEWSCGGFLQPVPKWLVSVFKLLFIFSQLICSGDKNLF